MIDGRSSIEPAGVAYRAAVYYRRNLFSLGEPA